MSSARLNPQSKAYQASPKQLSTYRQVDYYDGKSVRTIECRRGPPQQRTVSSDTLTIVSTTPRMRQTNYALTPSTTRSSDVRPDASVRPSPRPVHVTSAYRTRAFRPQTKAIIIQTTTPVDPAKASIISKMGSGYVSTPPPTPKIRRLPTPDLDELDERPFCNCCIDAHAVKYCASCGQCLKTSLF
ncbi:hypothetical protein CC80DRAFT_278443 [Byssothecium circinans]|uniref:Uncharacterized protein n=1 Tax=Byssothecium circinans TaxID=147558 RepID=A0A6A5TEK3_9PLEO|nr:hypothetical protein CC80DRAFT_278443 [Byssothecium circinans]